MAHPSVIFLPISPPTIFGNLPKSSPLFLVSPPRGCVPKAMKMVIASSRRGAIPARDIVIDFGKYKGRMLGTLPSTYLKWVSKNLRARDYQEWADRADQVLADPIYADRIEWENVQGILSANILSRVSGTRNHSNSYNHEPVSDLLEISKRFGWDNADKEGWGRVDFELLGTSKGGRIPRTSNRERLRTGISPSENDDSRRRISSSYFEEVRIDERNVSSGIEGRRQLRRERQKMRKTDDSGCVIHNQYEGSKKASSSSSPPPVAGRGNPFPGRQAILRKIGAVNDPN